MVAQPRTLSSPPSTILAAAPPSSPAAAVLLEAKREYGSCSSVCERSTTTSTYNNNNNRNHNTTTAAAATRSPPRTTTICISASADLLFCSPFMEATKNLAQRLRHRASLRRTNKKTARPAASADGKQRLETDDPERRESNTSTTSNPATLNHVPALVTSLDDPLTAPVVAPPAPSPGGSDVSPTTQQPPKLAVNGAALAIPSSPTPAKSPTGGYFDNAPSPRITFAVPRELRDEQGTADGQAPERDSAFPNLESAVSSTSQSSSVTSRESNEGEITALRRISTSGQSRSSFNSRHRNSSTSIASRRQKHVAFTNVNLGEPTKFNFPSHTLFVKHPAYTTNRRSRTFMVGIDDHQYSDEALQWLFDSFVDDGDEIVCVRVVERDVRLYETEKRLQDLKKEASAEVNRIKAKIGDSKSVSIILEYAVGKLHSTFQRLIQLHQPSMLIVGTRGRTLGGFQGLVASRNSFSKYCLQYSPVPVVVVRPDEKRQKKKDKRDNDPEKQSYRQMLQSSQGIHEANNEDVGTWEIESKISADEEAGKVAKALGLPAKFYPTLKPYKQQRTKSTLSVTSTLSAEPEPGRLVADSVATPTASAVNSEDEGEGSGEEEDEGEGDFEVTNGAKLLQAAQNKELKAQLKAQEDEKKKKDRLHAMEVGEGAALLQKVSSDEEEADEEEADDEEDDDEDQEDGGGAVQVSSS